MTFLLLSLGLRRFPPLLPLVPAPLMQAASILTGVSPRDCFFRSSRARYSSRPTSLLSMNGKLDYGT
jgi:hypothetical protein